MPGYYQQRSMASQMPLTPPDSGSGYGYSTMHYSQDPYSQPSQPCRQDTAYDYQAAAYLPPPVAAPAHPPYQYSSTTLPPIQGYYEPMGAPILPPLRIQDRVPFADDYQRRLQQNAQDQQDAIAREQQRQQATKEEKATGGVSAKLDYKMERMTDFVTEAAQSIFQHQMQGATPFRKWVHQVLSATRLPSATILLALHYLNDRVANYPASIAQGENQIYRLLAVALILGSKFLDDNTFINRSWSDVTAIKVTDLNALERTWLQLIHYELHIEPTSPNGLQAWMDAWHKYNAEWVSKQEYAAKQQHARLSPLDTTNVHRHVSNSRDRFSPYPTPTYSAPSRSFDAPLSARSSQYSTPYSASDPWAPSERQGLDDYYKAQPRYPSFTEADSISRRVSPERAPPQTAYYAPTAHPSYYQTPTYGSPWDQSAWNNGNHRYDCNCSTCVCQQHYRPYPLATNYSQPVIG